ncbi:Bax inhibitor-1/YccA family protein [Halobacteriovorax sp. GFR7]|uniref:Bax inhibitor-1/YccA family protein n=1 Tax=unclassified Halobacteriovorax TaxID=2639665 RepID=UPI003D9972C0
MRSTNPTLRNDVFNTGTLSDERMSFSGVFNKGMILFALMLMTFIYTWNITLGTLENSMQPQMGMYPMIGGIGGFIFAMVTIFKPRLAMFTAPAYALCEGLLLGSISAIYEFQFRGIVFNAVTITFAAFITLFFLYRWGFVRATGMFRKIIMTAMFSIMGIYLVSFIMSFFGASIPMIHGNGPVGIGFSLIVVGVAAFSLILDFDFIEKSVDQGAPKHLEWYAGFSLMVTLVWLYIEVLRLLSKLNSRD